MQGFFHQPSDIPRPFWQSLVADAGASAGRWCESPVQVAGAGRGLWSRALVADAGRERGSLVRGASAGRRRGSRLLGRRRTGPSATLLPPLPVLIRSAVGCLSARVG